MSFADLTRARYSCRSYRDEPVDPEALAAVLEAGRIAPSAHNNHPTRVLVCDTPELRAAAASAAPNFARGGSVFGAPVVLVVCARTGDAWVRRHDGMNSAHIDTSIVCDQMMMQATELGLGTCWVCMFDPEQAACALALPDGVEAVSMLTLGYPPTRSRTPRSARRAASRSSASSTSAPEERGANRRAAIRRGTQHPDGPAAHERGPRRNAPAGPSAESVGCGANLRLSPDRPCRSCRAGRTGRRPGRAPVRAPAPGRASPWASDPRRPGRPSRSGWTSGGPWGRSSAHRP